MVMKKNLMFLLVCFLFVSFGCLAAEDFKVLHQVTGAIETNCYLIYGVESKEAALVDPGGPVFSGLACQDHLTLRIKCPHSYPTFSVSLSK
jgi:glyoxylase-like metal-dependent hydrolase (beta-lactamase superfamily II)